MRAMLIALALLEACATEPSGDLYGADATACDPAWQEIVDERLKVIERDLTLLQAPLDGGCICR